MSDIKAPERYTISGEGKAGASGFAKGSATVNLAEDAGATVLRYTLHANVGGKLAQIGARLINSAAKKTADEFFTRFCALVAPDPETSLGATGNGMAADAVRPAQTLSAESSAQPPPAMRRGLSPLIWIGGVILLVAALVYVFG